MSDVLGTFAEFREQPILTFRNNSYMNVNRTVLRADAVRAAIESIYDDLNTQKINEFLDEM